MNLTISDLGQTAYIQNWDQTDWDAHKDEIPWNYTIEFDPNVDETVLSSLNTGRELYYSQRTIYIQEWIGNTMIVYPQIIFVQQLLPLPADPNAPTGDTNGP